MRIVRHWKQKFDSTANFIFTRGTQLEEGFVNVGDDVPEYLSSQGHRMKIWWNAGRIALKDWDYVKGCPRVAYETIGYGWYRLPCGKKVHGKKALEAAL